MKTILIVLYLLFSSYNNQESDNSIVIHEGQNQLGLIGNNFDVVSLNCITENIILQDSLNEVMLDKDIRFNGKVKRFFSLKDFNNAFGKADSTRLMIETDPCTYIFEDPHEEKGSKSIYIYKDGSVFESLENRVAVDEFKFLNGNYITFKGRVLNSSTSINDLKNLFPNAVKEIRIIDTYEEGKLQIIELREDENNISDGRIFLSIKKGKLYSISWWFPC